MRAGFYPKLAWDGIRKNKRLYFPYLLTGAVMVMMYYILSYLIESPALANMPGGSVLMSVLPLGCVVILAFSLLFLFYSNSFLIRQRYREFGLYNILGMDKRNISKVMFWECLMVAIIAIVMGMAAGIMLSKAAELVLLYLLDMDVSFEFSIGKTSLWQTPLYFGIIFFLLLLNSLIKVRRSKPLELMKANKVGEKLPKRIWIEAIVGVIFLGAAYYLAISIEEPLAALASFFVAVLLVIAGTYELFMAGSVALCKLLQKNKKYYYKANHFVSVSSMAYRMRRNGAGLASICILLTMVLVMVSSTASLYIGEEDSLRSRFPNGVNIRATFDTPDGIQDENVEKLYQTVLEHSGLDEIPYMRTAEIPGMFTEEGITIDVSGHMNFSTSTYNNVGYLSVLSLADYNDMTGKNETLANDECMLYCIRTEYEGNTFTMEYGDTYKVKKVLDDFVEDGEANSLIIPTIYLVVNDMEAFVEPVKDMKNQNGDPMMMYDWTCGFDMASTEEEIATANSLKETFRQGYIDKTFNVYSFSVDSREAQRASFLQVYGSLFFLGIMLSIVFLFAAVLIIYYKQISEGYEDQSRFDIMKKVGMTKKEIRNSINSQMLTVFFAPLLMAGVHICFAFPFLWKILMLFNMNNMLLIIATIAVCFVIFGLFYALVYKITSNAYYNIVSGAKE